MTQHILTSGKGLQCSRWLPAEEPVMARHFLPAPCLKSLGRGLPAGFSNFSYVFLAKVHVWLSFNLVWIFCFQRQDGNLLTFHPFLNVFVAKLASGVFFLTRHEFASMNENGTQQEIYQHEQKISL